ncbi:MAG: rubrerythrin family protein [Dehalococcoidia bacterium]|jgi:rubrerythrin
MSKSEDALKAAFAGESQGNCMYLAFAMEADMEGFPQVARLFRAMAEAEKVHAINFLMAIKGIKTTRDNLKGAIGGETYASTSIYPGMIDTAKTEGNKDAEISFWRANEVEKVHAMLCQGLMDTFSKGQENYSYYVCPVCGYTVGKDVPDLCPVCATKGKLFKKID